jgi:TolB-like protein/Tfp pilus assembly protein PilF
MSIWSAEIKELEKLYESFKGQLADLEKELERLVKADDENMILLYSRRCLEVIIADLCECQLKRERGTEPLKGIIDKLNKEKKVPSHIVTSMHGLNDLSTYGTHPKDFDPEQVKPVLNNLATIIKWYLKYKETGIDIKTKPAVEIRQEIRSTVDVKKSIHIPKKRLTGLLAGLILLIVIVVAVLLLKNIIGNSNQTKELDKSIAVLPFINDSPGDSNNYVINGLWAEVTNNLQTIKNLRVLSRTSTDQYKGPDRPAIPEIAKKLDVNYIVEASGQMIGSILSVRVLLTKAKGKETPIWAKHYEEEMKEVRDWVRIQSRIAKAITAEVKATMTPEEKQLIEKVPTTNLTAYDFYRMGMEEEGKFTFSGLTSTSTTWSLIYMVSNTDNQALERAEKMYKTALKYDPDLALAYTGLAGIYWSKNYYREYFSENFLDSVLVLAKKALSFDDQLPDAHYIMGMYYGEKGIYRQALEEFDKTLKYNPNYWLAYFGKANLFFDESNYVMALENFQEAARRYHGSGLSDILRRICLTLDDSGFRELAKTYNLEAIKLETDSIKYYFWLYNFEGDSQKKLEFLEKGYSIDSTNTTILLELSEYYLSTDQFKESTRFFRKFLDKLTEQGIIRVNAMHRIGYRYSKIGLRDSSEYYFNKQIKYCNDAIKLGRTYGISWAYWDLAGVYAFMGNKIKAYENLKNFNKKQRMPMWFLDYVKTDPLFESIRNEPEFQQIARDVEAKYQAEHERVRKWLEEQGML